MNSPTAPPPHDPDHDVGSDGRSVLPVPDGVPPVASVAASIDWSGDAESAAIGVLVDTLGIMDRLAVRAVEALIRILDVGATEAVLGVAPELVLSQTCRAAGFDRADLLRAATTLPRMAATRDAFRRGDLSWSQVRAICLHVRRLDVDGRAQVDGLVDRLAPGLVDVEADALVFEVEWLAAQLQAHADTTRDTIPIDHNGVSFKPRLDGSGTMISDYDATHFPLMVHTVDTQTTTNDPLEDHPDIPPDGALCDAELTRAHREAAKLTGRNAARRADALFELVTGRRADTLDPIDDVRQATGRASVLLTCPLDTLLDPDSTTPAWVLSTLTGRMRVTSDVARRWVDHHGTDTRVVLLDDGDVVGVGRKTRQPPGWLRDAVIARDLHDTAPCSTTSALLCDVDHVTGWTDGGPTDVDTLTLLSARWNRHKHHHWHHVRHPDGSATWTAKASGYTIRTATPPHLAILFDPNPSGSDPRGPAVNTTAGGTPGGHDPPEPRGP